MVNIKIADNASENGVNTIKKIAPEIVRKEPVMNTESFVTKNDFDDAFNRLGKQLNPESALSPEVRGMMKAVREVGDLKDALKDPTSVGIEQSMTTITTSILDAALKNMLGQNQQPAAQKPLINSLAEIATHNISAQLPQVLAGFKEILGTERMQHGYDVGLNYVENQQNQKNIVNIVMSLDENNDEHIVHYAELMGYTDFEQAKQMLIQHKVTLYNEQQQYQQVQQQEHTQQDYNGRQEYNEQQQYQQVQPIVQQSDEHIANEHNQSEQNITRMDNTQDFVRQSTVGEQQVKSVENDAVKVSVGKKHKKVRIIESENSNSDDHESSEDINLENTVDELLNEL